MYFHPSFLRVEMIERLFTQTYARSEKLHELNHIFPLRASLKWHDQSILQEVDELRRADSVWSTFSCSISDFNAFDDVFQSHT